MPRPRSSTFYLPLAPVDAPLSLKAKLSVLPPSAANALLAPRHAPSSCSQEFLNPNHTPSSSSSSSTSNGEDECARLERVLGLNGSHSNGGARRGARRHTDAPLPSTYGTHAPLPPLLPPYIPPTSSRIEEEPPTTPSLTHSSSTDSIESDTGMDFDFNPLPNIIPVSAVSMLSGKRRSEMKVETFGLGEDGFAGVSNESASVSTTEEEERIHSGLAMDLLEAAWDGELLIATTTTATGTTTTTAGGVSAEEVTGATEAEQVSFDLSTLELDSFAGACDMLHPSTSHSRSNSAESFDSVMVQQPQYDPSFGLPRPSTARSTTSSEPSTSQPLRTLSGVPCGLLAVVACRAKYRSPLCQSVTLEEEEIVHPWSFDVPTLESRSLHHFDYRHLLSSKFRQSYPPPPPPCAAVIEAERTLAMVVSVEGEMDIPVIEDSDLEGVEASLPTSDCSSFNPVPSTSSTTIIKAPARQRFRTPPSHVIKLLRKSLGTTTWQRAETLACARASERRHGWALRTQLGGHLRGLEREGLLGLAYSELAGTPLSQLVDDDNASSSSSGWAYMAGVVGLGEEFGASEWDFEDEEEEEEEFDEEMEECDEDLGCELAMEEQPARPFEREGAPEPEERLKTEGEESVGYTMVGRFTWEKDWSPISPSRDSHWPLEDSTTIRPISQDASSTASTSNSSVVTPTSATSNGETFWDMDDEEMMSSTTPTPSAPIAIKSRIVTDSLTIPRPGEPLSMEEEDEEIFRYSPLRDDGFVYERMEVEGEEGRNHESCDCPECQFQYSVQPSSAYGSSSSPTSPSAYQVIPSPTSSSGSIPVSPSFPPAPMVGTKISRSYSEDAFAGMSDEEMLDSPPQTASTSSSFDTSLTSNVPNPSSSSDLRPLWASHHTRPLKAPRPLSLVQQQQQYPAYVSDEDSSPASGVFVIPPSPLNNVSFGGEGGRTPTADSTFAASGALTAPPVIASTSTSGWHAGHGRVHSQERVLRSRSSVEHISSRRARQSFEKHEGRASLERMVGTSRRSFERIAVKRESMDITDLRRSSDGSQESKRELPNRLEATTPPVFVAPKPRRASRALEGMFGMESPQIRTGALPGTPAPTSTSTTSTPVKAAWTFGSLKNALSNSVSHLVELARSRSPSPLPWISRSLTGAAAASAQVTPTQPLRPNAEDLESERSATPTPAGRSRGSSTATLTQGHIPKRGVPQLALQTSEGELSTSPPPKRTLSTSSLSSVNSEPDSESGSSGGMFSRSPSPEPSAERIFDPSYSLTPRSRPISADAKAAVAAGGQLSPMMIPGSWDPEELWNDLQ